MRCSMGEETYSDHALGTRPVANGEAGSVLGELVHPSASELTMVSLITRHA